MWNGEDAPESYGQALVWLKDEGKRHRGWELLLPCTMYDCTNCSLTIVKKGAIRDRSNSSHIYSAFSGPKRIS